MIISLKSGNQLTIHEKRQAQHSIEKLLTIVCDGFVTWRQSLNYLRKLSCSIVDCVVHILTWNNEVVGGPIMARGDCLQRRRWS